jgi:DNA-binding transcriptional MerR regulator
VEEYLSIGEMAKLHGITRQTLLYYDNIGLFKPIKVTKRGYRFYGKEQMSALREICFLKSTGVSLKDIKEQLERREVALEVKLLNKQKDIIASQIEKLNKMREYLKQRITFCEEAADGVKMKMLYEPFVRYIGEREAVFSDDLPEDRAQWPKYIAELWKSIFQREMIVSCNIGFVLRKDSVRQRAFLKKARYCIFLPYHGEKIPGVRTIPAGDFVCIYAYGMYYDITYMKKILTWINANGYELRGDILDVCLLNKVFCSMKNTEFSMIQAPVRKK